MESSRAAKKENNKANFAHKHKMIKALSCGAAYMVENSGEPYNKRPCSARTSYLQNVCASTGTISSILEISIHCIQTLYWCVQTVHLINEIFNVYLVINPRTWKPVVVQCPKKCSFLPVNKTGMNTRHNQVPNRIILAMPS